MLRTLAAIGMLALSATAVMATPMACEGRMHGKGVVMKITEAVVEADPLAHYKQTSLPLHFVAAKNQPQVVKQVFSTTFQVPPVPGDDGVVYSALWTLDWPLWESTTPTFLRDSFYQQRILAAVKNEKALATVTPTQGKPENYTLTYLLEEDGKCVSELAYDEVTMDMLPPELGYILAKLIN